MSMCAGFALHLLLMTHRDVQLFRLGCLRSPPIAGESSPPRRIVALLLYACALPRAISRSKHNTVGGATSRWLGETWDSARHGDVKHLRLRFLRLPLIAGKSSPARRNVAFLFYARALPPTIPRQNLKTVRGGKSHWLGETWCFVRPSDMRMLSTSV